MSMVDEELTMRGDYYYQIIFNDGRVIRRERVSKKLAVSVSETMSAEMLLFEVHEVSWGVMQ